ncbi:MAG: hypothetical protein QOJ99_346 [Bryobacterales bacterium]|jgi:hypothetical protein|nr:hypothetical protein [Bryobacterales bacterium]
MKSQYMRVLPAILAIGAGIQTVSAQVPQTNVYFGLGTATDSSSNRLIDTFGTGNPFTTPKLGGLMADLGASIMLTKHYGVGGDLSWRTSQGAYAGLNYRPLFYNVDGVYQPVKTRRFEPELRAGLGGVSVRYSYSQQSCDGFVGCTSSNQFVESSSHFQVHAAAAARLYVTNHVFVRPAFDLRYVNNFYQFGNNWVPQYSVGVGWSFGRGE